MPILHIPVSDKLFAWLSRETDRRNKLRKKGEKEVRITDVAKDKIVPFLDEQIEKEGKGARQKD